MSFSPIHARYPILPQQRKERFRRPPFLFRKRGQEHILGILADLARAMGGWDKRCGEVAGIGGAVHLRGNRKTVPSRRAQATQTSQYMLLTPLPPLVPITAHWFGRPFARRPLSHVCCVAPGFPKYRTGR